MKYFGAKKFTKFYVTTHTLHTARTNSLTCVANVIEHDYSPKAAEKTQDRHTYIMRNVNEKSKSLKADLNEKKRSEETQNTARWLQ